MDRPLPLIVVEDPMYPYASGVTIVSIRLESNLQFLIFESPQISKYVHMHTLTVIILTYAKVYGHSLEPKQTSISAANVYLLVYKCI